MVTVPISSPFILEAVWRYCSQQKAIFLMMGRSSEHAFVAVTPALLRCSRISPVSASREAIIRLMPEGVYPSLSAAADKLPSSSTVRSTLYLSSILFPSSYYKVVVFIVPLQGLYAILLEILWIV